MDRPDAPPRRPVRWLRIGEVALMALLALGLEIAIWRPLADGGLTLWQAGALHAGLSGLLTLWALLVRKRRAVRMATLLALTTAFLGPFGAAGTLLALMINLRLEATAQPFEAWYMALFPEETQEPADDLFESLASGRETAHLAGSVASFADVMQAGTIDQKCAVLSLLTRHFRPAFAPALRLALADPVPMIRVQAATAAAEIENDFLERTVALSKACREAPSDAGKWLELGKLYDAYAFTGLLDAERERENRAQAREAYERALALTPDDVAIHTALGRLWLRIDRPAEAAQHLLAVVESDAQGGEALSWLCECLYRLKRFDELRALSRHRLNALPERDGGASADAIRLWAQGLRPALAGAGAHDHG